MFRRLREKKAFTLVEIMIVVAIIGLLIAIALPNFMKARNEARKNLCYNNLRLIGHAVEQARIELNLDDTQDPTEAQIGNYIKGGYPPRCPSGGTYSHHGNLVTCDVHGTYNIATGNITP